MEIHIQLAGVQLGPYSEKQVRDYLAEGLLAPDDPARLEGTENWGVVSDVLAKLPAPAPAAAVPPPPPPSAKKPEPVALPPQASIASQFTQSPATDAPSSIAPIATAIPRIDPKSKETIRIAMPQLAKSLPTRSAPAPVPKETVTGDLTPSSLSTGMGKSAEEARSSLLSAVKILAQKPEPEEKPTPAEEAPPISRPSLPPSGAIPLPKSSETMRTMPMSIVRAIAKKPTPDEKPTPANLSPAPSTISAPPVPEKSEDLKRTSLLSAVKVLAKSPKPTVAAPSIVPTVDEPKSPSALIAPGSFPKTPESALTMPMSAVRALPRKQAPERQAPATQLLSKAPSATPTPTPMPKPAAETTSLPPVVRFRGRESGEEPESGTQTSPVPEDAVALAKSLKRTTGSLPTLVKVLAKKRPPVAGETARLPAPTTPLPPPPEPAVEETPQTKTSSITTALRSLAAKMGFLAPSTPDAPEAPPEIPEIASKTLEPEPALDTKPETKPETKAAPTPEEDDEFDSGEQSKKLTRFIVPVLVGAVVLGGAFALISHFYIQYAYQSADLLHKALNAGDPAILEKVVDFPSVRENLRDEVDNQITKSGTQAASGQSGASSDPAAVLAMIKNSIDYYVTPEAISTLLTKPDQLPKDTPGPTVNATVASAILQKFNSLTIKSQGLISATQFVIDMDAVKLDLQFSGFDWKLYRIELKTDFQLPSTPGSATSSSDLGSSLVTPVIETYLGEGNAAFQKADWDTAITDFTKVLAIDPKQTVAYSNRAMARRAKGDLDGAVADFTQAISLDPKLATAFVSRGDAKSANNDLDGAIADYTQAVNLDPKLSGAFYSRGNAKTMKGDYDGAVSDFAQVIALDPNNANAYSNRGFVRQAKNDLDGAISDYTQALSINPKLATTYYNRGLSKQAKADLDGAIADYNQALDLDPKMTGAYYNRGNAKNTKHDLDGAIADYTQALTLDPKIALAYCNRALAKQAKNDFKGALADYNEALTLDPNIAVAYYNRGLIKEQQNDQDGAIADSSRALDLDPKEAQAYYNRGFAKLAKGNLDGSRADLEKFCDLAPKDPYADHARLYLWLISMAQNPSGTANQDLSDALQNNWNSSPDDFVSKLAGFLLDRVTEADLVSAAASTNPKKDQGQHCEVWYFAGMKRLLAGDKPTAIDYFRKCLATGQKDYCEYILAQAELQILAPTP